MADPPVPALRAIAAGLEGGTLTCVGLVEGLLDRIAALEPEVRAWAFLDPAIALDAARRIDRDGPRGPLAGVPVGVKDIIDTADMPTGYGSPLYAGHRPPRDASCVALLRRMGGLVLGKTVTTEFAYFGPGPTRNPHDPARTPGGSSSGSAAAVAAGMVPVAFGTQTAASISRPASYCGVVGYKPSFGLLDRTGVRPFADSLDTLGALARTVDDAAWFCFALAGRPAPDLSADPGAVAIGLCRTHEWDQAAPESRAALETAAARLSALGATVREVSLPAPFRNLWRDQKRIMAVEGARACAAEMNAAPDRLSAPLRELIALGEATTPDELDQALDRAARARAAFPAVMDGLDALICPAAMGEAPEGIAATGNPIFSRVWTLLGVPSLAVPGCAGPNGMPVGVQVVGRYRDDARTLAVAALLEGALSEG